MTVDPNSQSSPNPESRERFLKFMRVFEQGEKAAERTAKASEMLLAAIADEKNGLIRALDDLGEDIAVLINEIRALRGDLQTFANVVNAVGGGMGFEGLLGSVFGGRRGRH